MKNGVLKDLDYCPLPMKTNSIPMYLLWHKYDQDDPAHKWFRERIIGVVSQNLVD
jgi:hypothetical protein